MNTVLVYTKSVAQNGQRFNSEIKRQALEVNLSGLQSGKDFVIDKDGKLLKVLEKIADLAANEMRILVREM